MNLKIIITMVNQIFLGSTKHHKGQDRQIDESDLKFSFKLDSKDSYLIKKILWCFVEQSFTLTFKYTY